MFYEHDIVIPPNTHTETFLSQTLRLTRGIIKRVDLVFPAGCAGLVGVRIVKHSFQVIPLNYPKWIETDAETVSIQSEIDLTEIPYELEFQGYNLDDTFEHTIRVRVLMEPASLPFRQKTPMQESEELLQSLGL